MNKIEIAMGAVALIIMVVVMFSGSVYKNLILAILTGILFFYNLFFNNYTNYIALFATLTNIVLFLDKIKRV